jgi:hypothetical protein
MVVLLTAVNKMIDLFFGHACAFDCAQGPLLLLTPVVDESEVFSVARFEPCQSGSDWGKRRGVGRDME